MGLQVTQLSATDIESQFTVRPATMADLDRVLEFMNRVAQHYTGAPELDREELAHRWQHENLIIENNVRLILTPNDEIIGFISTWDLLAPYTQLGVWAGIHPDYANSGIGEYLFQWAENRLRQTLHKAPADAKVIMRMARHYAITPVQDAAKAHGMELVRQFYTMAIDFAGPPPTPVWPDGITLRTFVQGQDEYELYSVIDSAFLDHWGNIRPDFNEWQRSTIEKPDFDPTLYFLAVNADQQIIGAALCEKALPELPDNGWVSTLAVLRTGRGQGLGMALLLHAFGEFYQRGFKGGALGVDAENLSGALRLYEKAGMHAIDHWNVYFKTLRDGTE